MPIVMNAFNISATLNLFRLAIRPRLCLPQASIPTFNHLPVPLNEAFGKHRNVDIKAVVLDKDNCFAIPNSSSIYKPYEDKFAELKAAYPGRRLLIVSNTAGTSSIDPSGKLASEVEAATGVTVLSHSTKKPGCSLEIMEYFLQNTETGVTRPNQIAVVGDRLMTDVMLANMMGGYAVWLQDGILPRERTSIFAIIERRLAAFLLRRGYETPRPSSASET